MLRLCARLRRPLLPGVGRRYAATQALNSLRIRLAQSRDGPELRNDYLAFLDEYKRQPPQGPVFSLRELTLTMEKLATSTDPEDLALARQLVHDMPLFGFRPSLVHYNHAIRAMARSSDVHPRDVLAFIAESPAGLPVYSLWSTLVYTYQKAQNLSALLTCAHETGVDKKFVEMAYSAVVDVMSRLPNPLSTADIQTVLQEMQDKGIKISPMVAHVVREVCKRTGIDLSALPAGYTLSHSSPTMPLEAWMQKLTSANSEHIFWGEISSMMRDGHAPTNAVLTAAARFIDTAEGLSRAASKLGLTADLSHWTTVVGNAARRGYPAASQVFRSAVEAGCEPSSVMAEPVVRSLLANTVIEPPSWALTRAMKIFRQMKAADRLDESSIALCQVIMNALNLSSSPLAAGFRKEILQDVEERGICMHLEPSVETVEHAIFAAKSHQEALDAYRTWRDNNPAEHLSIEVCRRILHHICCLTFPDAPVVPPFVFNEFVRDLVWRGYPISHQLYSIAFDRYAIGARALVNAFPRQPARLCEVHDAAQELHQRMLFDLSITPDTRLWNRLMSAYSYTGDHDAALAIFRQLQESGNFTEPSVSIAFDACGFGKRLDDALAIRRWLDERGYALNVQNWTAYVECMCRCDELDRALDAVCQIEDGTPDAINTANIALKFTLYDRRQAFVREQLRGRMPRTWAALEGDEDAPIGQAGRLPVKLPPSGNRNVGKWQRPGSAKAEPTQHATTSSSRDMGKWQRPASVEPMSPASEL